LTRNGNVTGQNTPKTETGETLKTLSPEGRKCRKTSSGGGGEISPATLFSRGERQKKKKIFRGAKIPSAKVVKH